MTTTRLATASCALGMLSYVGLMGLLNVPDAAADDQEEPQQVLELTGIVRDFRERTADSGHPDFERRPDHGFALSCGNVAPYLDDDGKPVYTGEGYTVKRQWSFAATAETVPNRANEVAAETPRRAGNSRHG